MAISNLASVNLYVTIRLIFGYSIETEVLKNYVIGYLLNHLWINTRNFSYE